MNKADEVFALYHYKNRYVGGHSLGGAMASEYAAGHGEELTGVILLAAYPTEPLDGDLTLLSVYGSEDGVLNTQKVAEGRGYAPARYTEQTITGGNHAQFGNYGVQKGDGAALISAGAQQEQTADLIMQTVMQADAGSN
jgi:pimeloyl-ACP methyl ester carboxylesterase